MQGIIAEQKGIDLNIIMMEDYFEVIPDYYTPVVIASEKTIKERPEVIKAVLKALSKGYEFSIKNPSEAADILLKASPELGKDLARNSQEWMTNYYKAEATRWGEQKLSIWQDYIDWEVEHAILEEAIKASDCFTTEFLP